MSIKKRIVAILSDGQPHSAQELATVSHRFSAAIHSLREDGYEIETIQVAHNDYVYQMTVLEKKSA
jgi:biotin operon repressor